MADSGDDRAVSPANDQAEDNGAVEATDGAQNGEAAQQGQQQQQQQPQRQGGWAMIKSLVIRMVVIYFISSWLRRPSTPAKPGEAGPGTAAGGLINQPSTNLYDRGTYMDLYVYYSESEVFEEFHDSSLLWQEEELIFGDWSMGEKGDGTFERSGKIIATESMMNNGSIYLHVFLVRSGRSPDPSDKDRYDTHTVYKFKRLNKFKKRKFHKTVNLLTGTTDAHPDLVRAPSDNVTLEILSHWHPNLTLNLIDDHTPWAKGSVPAPLDEFIDFLDEGQAKNKYNPILFFNEYWNLNSEYMPINHSTPVLNFTITYQPITLFRWQMYAAQGMRQRWYSFLGDDFMEESDEDQDSLKQAVLETNPWLLGLTIVVSIVHSVFEFLAFKNDIQFWRNRKSMEGLSVRSVFFNVFQSLIVLLYVLDNETNFVVRVSVFIGLGIEIWKIFKVVDVKLDRENPWIGGIPRILLQDKSTYTQSSTKKYDTMAFKYLSWALFPMLAAYSIYSLFYMEHKGWYSWVLNMLYGFLLTFGFIMMTPQLFINYKLKSVAHLPWRMLTYKALNTFIDDLFAFVIKMPTLYRLGCFRDDIVFLIYLYQRYKYRVDPKRMNEFGTSGEMFEQNGEAVTDSPATAAITDNGEPPQPAPKALPPKKDKKAKKKD